MGDDTTILTAAKGHMPVGMIWIASIISYHFASRRKRRGKNSFFAEKARISSHNYKLRQLSF